MRSSTGTYEVAARGWRAGALHSDGCLFLRARAWLRRLEEARNEGGNQHAIRGRISMQGGLVLRTCTRMRTALTAPAALAV